MKSLGLISQVLTIAASIAIAVTYIQPTFEEIGTIQDEISQYQELLQKVEKANRDLSQHVATLASFSPGNIEKLNTYMPRNVDDIGVMRDLQFIVDESGMIFKTVGYGGESDVENDSELDPVKHEFSVTAEGTYSQLKNFFSLLEQNEYPLEIHNAEIAPLEGGFLSADLTLVTYADELTELNEIDD